MSFLARKKKLLMQSAIVPAQIAYGAASVTDAGTLSSPETFTSVPIGSIPSGVGATNRHVIVAIMDNVTTLTSVTVGGVSCTQRASFTANSINVRLWVTDSPVNTGTTASIVVAFTGGGALRIAAFAAYDLQSTTATATATTSTNGGSMSCAISAGGVLVALSYGISNGGTVSGTWSGATESFDSYVSWRGFTGAIKASVAGETASVSCTLANTQGGLGMAMCASFR